MAVHGISWINFGIKDIEERDSSGKLLGKFSDNENAFLFSIGRFINKDLSIGFNAKYLKHDLKDNKASGYGFDIGTMYAMNNHVNFGVILQDLASSLDWDTESGHSDDIPIKCFPSETPGPKRVGN
jgi:hypothetical protein